MDSAHLLSAAVSSRRIEALGVRRTNNAGVIDYQAMASKYFPGDEPEVALRLLAVVALVNQYPTGEVPQGARYSGAQHLAQEVSMSPSQRTLLKEQLSFNTQFPGAASLLFGTGQSSSVKGSNYKALSIALEALNISVTPSAVRECVTILCQLRGDDLEAEEPEERPQIASLRKELDGSTAHQKVIDGVVVRLDIDQNKHQHPKTPIGKRQAAGGTRFEKECDASWHELNTMPHMAEWAREKSSLSEGEKRYHGQVQPVEGIHYEGYCVKLAEQMHVLYHCYPPKK